MYIEEQVKMYQADLLEECSEYLSLRMCHYMFAGKKVTKDIEEFVAWCLAEDKIDIHAPRAHDRKSFYERREEAKRRIMNYYKARQRDSNGRWDYTCMNDDRGSPVGYCRKYKEWTPEEIEMYHLRQEDIDRPALLKHKYHSDGHATKEEAEACYLEFLLDQELSLNHKDTSAQHKCEICGEWTQGFAYLDMRVFILCEKHQNKESVAKVFGSITEIWSST